MRLSGRCTSGSPDMLAASTSILLMTAGARSRSGRMGGVSGFPPVRFRRPAGMLSIPAPERGGSVEALASFLNLPSRNDFVLVVGWPLAALRFGDPYPLLATSGEQGSAKAVSVHR